jgi:formylaminopyrimidine deformylase / aminopyrimidine aminohydrolase
MATPTVEGLLRKHRPAFNLIAHNPLALAIRSGTLRKELFDRWLFQAYCLLEGHFAPVSRLVAVAPPRDRPPHLEGLEILRAEIAWYEGLIAERGLDTCAAIHPVILKMKNQMVALAFEPYVVGIVAFWAQADTYASVWQTRRPPSGPYKFFLSHWGDPRGRQWVRKLGRIANRALAEATPRENAAAEEAFARVVDDKPAYWSMVLG